MYFTSIKSGSISFIITVCLALPGLGQVAQLDRYELTLENRFGVENPQVTSLGSEGILVQRRIKGKTKDQLELIKLDTTLHENWRGVITVEKNLSITMVVARDKVVYMLLRSVAYGNFDFNVIAMDIRSRGYRSYLVKNLIPFSPSDFNITTTAILIGGYFNSRPVVLHFSFASGRSRLLPGFFNDLGEINQIKTYDDGLIDILVSTRNIQRKKVLWIRSYTPEGDLIHATILEGGLDKNLIFGKSLRTEDGTLIIAGSFGVRNVEFSRGIFTTEVSPGDTPVLKYYNFSDLENFFKFMRPKRETRVVERIEKRKQRGKQNRKSYRFLPQELLQHGNEFLLLGETYFPRYTYANPYGFFGGNSIYSGSTIRGERIFDGYRYTHASVIGFDKIGKLVWDNSLEINDIKTFTLKQYVKLTSKEDQLGMLYLFDNELRSKTIQRNQVVEGKSTKALKSKYEDDIVREKDTESSDLENWYDPYFYAYGIQFVRSSKNGMNDSGRKVLFINKLKFQ
jgi:hypothetical protein